MSRRLFAPFGRAAARRPVRGTRPLALEALEDRTVPTAAVIPAAVYDAADAVAYGITPAYAVGSPVTDLNGTSLLVTDTQDFASSGYLFLQTTNGVATVQYAGKSTLTKPGTQEVSDVFTGLQVVGDIFNVGAGDQTGTLEPSAFASIYQATNQTFDFPITNATNTTHTIYAAVVWQSKGGNFYYLQPGTSTYALAGGTSLNWGAIPFTGGEYTLKVPYIPTNGARVFLSVGQPSAFTPNSATSITGLSPITTDYPFDFFEFTLDAQSEDPASQIGRRFSGQTVDTTQVDQFGFPITFSGTNLDGSTTTLGVSTAPGVTRDAIFSGFTSYVAQQGQSAYAGLELGKNRLLNPTDYLSNNQNPTSPLMTAFDEAIHQLFENPQPGMTLTANGTTYTVSAGTNVIGINTYNVLKLFDGTDTMYVYEPFFAENSGEQLVTINPSKIGATFTLNWGTAPNIETTAPITYSSDPATLAAAIASALNLLPGVDEVGGATVTPGQSNQFVVKFLTTQALMTFGNALDGTIAAKWPPAPSWLMQGTSPPGNIAPSVMVFGNEGVFTDAANQSPTPTNVTNLGLLERQLVAALNRGVANVNYSGKGYNSTTEAWDDITNYYPAGQVSNLYGKFLHNYTIGGNTIFINGQTYAISYDDNDAAVNTYVNQSQVSITLGAWNDNEPNDNYIDRLYHDLLGRAPDPAGFAYWTSQLDANGNRDETVLGILNSIEYFTDRLNDFYQEYLGRLPDPTGLSGFLHDLTIDGETLEGVKASILGSVEYFHKNGGTAIGFLTALYQDVLGRSVDPTGLAGFTAQLDSGVSWISVAFALLNSDEDRADLVGDWYTTYLGRSPQPGELDFWVDQLAEGQRDQWVLMQILASNEFYDE